jgi:SAM-dependent methyltransferase
MSDHQTQTFMDDLRYRREAEFHDKTFGEHTRADIDKFYSITASSKSLYRNYLIENCAGKRILEYGCGPHTLAPLLTPKGATITGIDISSTAATEYRKLAVERNVPAVFSCVMNAEGLGFSQESFDLICGTGILHHLDLRRSFSELARVLKPQGTALFLEPLGHNPFINLYRKLTPSLRSVDEHPLLMEDFALADAYFGRLEITYFHLSSLFVFPFRKMPGFQSLLEWCDSLDRFFFRIFPPLRRHAWAAVMILSEPRK